MEKKGLVEKEHVFHECLLFASSLFFFLAIYKIVLSQQVSPPRIKSFFLQTLFFVLIDLDSCKVNETKNFFFSFFLFLVFRLFLFNRISFFFFLFFFFYAEKSSKNKVKNSVMNPMEKKNIGKYYTIIILDD